MSAVESKKRERPVSGRETGDAVDTCLLCRRTSDEVQLVFRDRTHGYSMCDACMEECARTIACSCVC